MFITVSQIMYRYEIVKELGKMFIISSMLFSVLIFQKSPKKDISHTYEDITDMLARFVINSQGEKIGESIAVYHDILIVKDKDVILGIPLKHVSFEGKKLLAKGLIDTTKAKKLGDTWKKESYKEISPPDEEL